MFLVKPLFSRYFRKFLVTTPPAEVTMGYIDTLLSYQVSLISRAKFSDFVIFSASVLGNLWFKGSAICITSVVSFSLSISTISSLLKSTVVSVTIDLP